MPLFTSKQLSNEEYHKLPEVGGSTLVKIFNDCPAAWKYGENEPTKALVDGIAAHVCVLEPSLFAERFVRGLVHGNDVLVTNDDMKAWLTERGIKGGSNKKKDVLIQMIHESEPDQKIAAVIEEEFIAANEGKVIVKPADFDMITAMRSAIYRQPDYKHMLTNTVGPYDLEFEKSFISSHGTKVRWDCITADGYIVDYKTCVSSHPDLFGRSAANNGYWLKMAFQHDHFMEAFGEKPKGVILLAQSKKHPYIPKAYRLTNEQLRVGRDQYTEALNYYNACLTADQWPSYSLIINNERHFPSIMDLPTPGYLAYEYGMEEELEYVDE